MAKKKRSTRSKSRNSTSSSSSASSSTRLRALPTASTPSVPQPSSHRRLILNASQNVDGKTGDKDASSTQVPSLLISSSESETVSKKSFNMLVEKDPSNRFESDYFLYGENSKKFTLEQESFLLTPSKKAIKTPRRTQEKKSNQKSSETNEHSFSYGDIIIGKSKLDRLTPENGVRCFIEQEEIKSLENLKPILKRAKAQTVWSVSEGLSSTFPHLANVSYYMNDYDKYIHSDSRLSARRPSSSYSARQSRRNSIRTFVSGSSTSSILANTAMDTLSEKIQNSDIFDAQQSIEFKSPSLFATFSTPISFPKYVGSLSSRISQSLISSINDSTSSDVTWRSYSVSPTGRPVSSIYHPYTKQPSNVNFFMDKSSITNESLYTYITTEYVQEINLERCYWLSNRIIENIGQFCHHLSILNLQNCSQIIDRTVIVIANGCPNISSLNLGMCSLVTDAALEEVFKNFKFLKVLSIHSCNKVNGSSFQYIKNCGSLEVLDVSYCKKLDDMSLHFVAESCQNLTHLDISGCTSVGDEGLERVVKHCEDLETLRVMLCDQGSLTLKSLSVITKLNGSIRVLELTGVAQIDDESVKNIAKYGQGLEFLALNGCSKITDQSLKAMSENCTSLRCCELCSCRLVTLNGLIELVHSLDTLKKIAISECNISESELEILRSVTTRCQVIKQGPSVRREAKLTTHVFASKEKKIAKKKQKKKK